MIRHSHEEDRIVVMGVRESTLEKIFNALLGAFVLAALAASPIFAADTDGRKSFEVADLRPALPSLATFANTSSPNTRINLDLLTRVSDHEPNRTQFVLRTVNPEPLERTADHPVLRAIRREASGEEFLRAELVRQLKDELPGGGFGVTLERVRMTPPREFPQGEWTVNYDLRLPSKGVGTVVFTGRIMQAGREVKRFGGSAMIDRRANGVQVRRLIRRGERIGPDDLITMPAKLSRLPNDAFQSHESLTGTAARSELRPGVWLTGRMLELPTVVRTRQLVTMRLKNGGIEVNCKGVVKQNGALGEIIRVQSVQSNREVMARVISRELVEVVF